MIQYRFVTEDHQCLYEIYVHIRRTRGSLDRAWAQAKEFADKICPPPDREYGVVGWRKYMESRLNHPAIHYVCYPK
jgi:hypothetical protein